MMRGLPLPLIALLLCAAAPVRAQMPPPVDLPIPNLLQETEVWCWAAVAQQIIHASQGPAQTPPQCALVAMANGAAPEFCCSGHNPSCVRTGNIPQIQFLIGEFGGRFSSYSPPASAELLYATLAAGRAVILHVRTGLSSSHVVVLRGMSFMPTAYGVEPVLHINDPLSYFTQPVPLRTLLPIWIDAIVVH